LIDDKFSSFMAVSADNYLSRIDGKTRHAFRLADTPARTVGRCRRIDPNPAAEPRPAFLVAFLCAGYPVLTGYYGYSPPCPLYPRSPAEPEPVPAEVEDERAGAEREEPDIDLGLP
jgi:hypothetical protein